MNWMRLYQEARTDKKLESLTDGQFRVWFNLLCFSGDQEIRGTIVYDDLDLLAVEVASGETDLLSETLARLVKLKIITNEDGAVFFLNFEKRQYDKPSDTPERVAERVRRHRENKRNGDVTLCNASVTPSNAIDTELDTERDTLKPHGFNDAPLPPKKIKADPKPAKQPTYPQDFESFFDAYPGGRGGRPQTYQVWKQLSAEDKGAVLAAMPAFLAGRDWIEGFQPSPKRWLEDRRWEKPPAPMAANGRASPNDRPATHHEIAQQHYDTIQNMARGESS